MGKGGLIATDDFVIFLQTWYTLWERGIGGLTTVPRKAWNISLKQE